MATASRRDGRPVFYQSGIPSKGELGDYEPRVYFGTGVPGYSIVGSPEGTTPWELDYPDDGNGNSGQVNNTFTGDGGPKIGSTFERLMFALKFGEQQILFSDRVTPDSQILFHRDPIDRVQRVAPYLKLDATTYPAVVDGRIVWVVDGYTSTADFPYSASITSKTLFSNPDPLNPTVLNYVRNSVKATVDAYNGAVTLYAWDPEDPILQTWQKVFPSTLKPYSEMSARPHEPHALSRGPVHDSALPAHALPRDERLRLLLGSGLLGEPARTRRTRPSTSRRTT